MYTGVFNSQGPSSFFYVFHILQSNVNPYSEAPEPAATKPEPSFDNPIYAIPDLETVAASVPDPAVENMNEISEIKVEDNTPSDVQTSSA